MIKKMIDQKCEQTGMSGIADGVLARFNKDDLVDGVYVVPDEVHTIKQFAFNDVEEVKKVILPKTLKRIEYVAFANCGLEEIEIPEGVKEIEVRTFRGCANLSKVILPTTIQWIRTNAFDGCDSLKQITVPKGARVAKDAFGNSKVEVVYQENIEVTK